MASENLSPTHQCNNCGKKGKVQCCSRCKSVYYCNEACQKRHWQTHKILCSAIQCLSDRKEEECQKKCFFNSNLDPEQERVVVSLVGRRCRMRCKIKGRKVQCLMDSGAQVSLLSLRWLKRNLQDFQIEDISTVMDGELEVEGVNGKSIPYVGIVRLPVDIGNFALEVPFLVTQEQIVDPIIGFNVLQEMIGETEADQGISNLRHAFQHLTEAQTEALVNCLLKKDTHAFATVTTFKNAVVVKAGASISIPCRVDGPKADQRIPALFEPYNDDNVSESLVVQESLVTLKKGSSRIFVTVSNTSTRDVYLQGPTVLGELSLVQSVIPTEVKEQQRAEESVGEVKNQLKEQESVVNKKEKGILKELKPESVPKTSKQVSFSEQVEMFGHQKKRKDIIDEKAKVTVSSVKEKYRRETAKESEQSDDDQLYSKLFDGMDLSMLDESQQKQVKEMLWEEREVFSKDEGDIGCAQDLQMEIKTEDETPVQKNYNAIPRKFYDEVKHHIQDLLNKGWITKSKSAWSSPVVLVRKKCGGLRLCVD